MSRCRESQGWITACSSMPERDAKDQGEDSPKQAGSCWFARHSLLGISGANTLRALVCRCYGVFLGCYVGFILLYFCVYAFIEVVALRSIVLRFSICMRPDSHRCLFIFPFFFEMSLFPSFFVPHYRFIFVWRVLRTFSPSGWCFSTLRPRTGFFI